MADLDPSSERCDFRRIPQCQCSVSSEEVSLRQLFWGQQGSEEVRGLDPWKLGGGRGFSLGYVTPPLWDLEQAT